MTDNPLISKEVDSTEWYTGIGIAESISDLVQGIESGNWADIGLGATTTALEALSLYMDPIGSVASNLISFVIEHVGPLQEILDQLAGNADGVAAQARTWANVAKAVGQVKTQYEREAVQDTSGWAGSSGDAYRKRAADTAALLGGAAEASSGIASAVEMAGVLVGVVREFVRDLIADLVGRCVVWAIEALTVVGAPLVAAQAATAAAKWAARIAQIVKQLLRALEKLKPLLKRLDELLKQIRKKMDEFAGRKGGSDKPPKDPNDPPGTTSGGDPFDDLPKAEQDRLIDELIEDSNKDFPLTRENAREILRNGPPGTTPEVAGPGTEGADVVFRDKDGNIVASREAKNTDGTYNTFNGELKHATKQINNNGEVWFQVPPDTDADSWIRRWQGQRTDEQLGKYGDVVVVIRDSAGFEIGRYDLGRRLPPR
ncbi:hypothetical protein SK803_43515 [Lentzea sp. BCCO 10_0856]|uniref:WXG100 family type VII secretion target n=1 Tax=Lentzea miocenica TaxID=3095431 RepID=A0ABU4TGV4_9PSEU|nr:hypothetical protein [Lentzea sp. BCCO 10_0856]MDX8037103.1 hypothetical protein [Lentzea sp. BCCO 10_0856]